MWKRKRNDPVANNYNAAIKMISKLCYSLLLIMGSCTGMSKDQSASETQTSLDITKVELKELSNKPLDLKQFKGKTVFINFWATWCKPCIQEMPTIQSAMDSLKNKDVIFLLASNEETEQINRFIKRYTYNFHYVHLENMEDLKIQALPTTFIFNKEGKLKFSEVGYRKWDEPQNLELIIK